MIDIYKDKALTERVSEFHLGTVEAGIAETRVYYISNKTNAELHEFGILFFEGKNEVQKPKGLKVVLPKFIGPNGTGRLVVTWEPSPTFKRALSVKITITYKELYIAVK